MSASESRKRRTQPPPTGIPGIAGPASPPGDFPENGPPFIIGIDLGTTQCALSFFDTREPAAGIRPFQIPQFVGASQVANLPTLPSVAFIDEEKGAPDGPEWRDEDGVLVGQFARERGFEVPGRVVHSAKSWLCNPKADRTAPILPWQSETVTRKRSPIEISALFLRHLAQVWDSNMAAGRPENRFTAQKVIVTIPASFDPVARNLTLEAIGKAGLSGVTLLEEPQAAFYDFIYRHPKDLEKRLEGVRTVLVVDIGGGTTDFSLIQVKMPKGAHQPEFHRLAVGPHLLVGGDNLDLAVAKFVEGRFQKKGRKLIYRQWMALLNQSRKVKEDVLSGLGSGTVRFTLPGAGSRVVSQTLSEDVGKDEIRAMLMDGFFPPVGRDERPEEEAGIGISEAGLPYTRDPAVTKHLAMFLGEHGVLPDAVLYNGGTLLSTVIDDRLTEIFAEWRGGDIPLILQNPRPTLAVSCGAVYFGMVEMGFGQRIKSGNPVSLYLGIGTAEGSTASAHVPEHLMCLLPKGAESNREYSVEGKTFGLDTRGDVAFYLFFTPAPPKDEALGTMAGYSSRKHRPLPPLSFSTPAAGEPGIVEASLRVILRDSGYLQVFCDETGEFDGARTAFQRELVFDLSGREKPRKPAAAKSRSSVGRSHQSRIRKFLDGVFESQGDPQRFNGLFKGLEEILGDRREAWNTDTLRSLFPIILEEDRFSATEDGLTWYLRLLGYTLRPGFGSQGDTDRVGELLEKFRSPPTTGSSAFWTEWWIMWRRIAPGLAPDRQATFLRAFEPLLFPPKRYDKSLRQPEPHEKNQIWRFLGQLEKLPVSEKERLGWWILRAPASFGRDPVALYALGRMGAREMSYAGSTLLVPQATVQSWTEGLLQYPDTTASYFDWALRELGRKTGDRLVQIDDATRKRIVDLFKKRNRKKQFLTPLIEIRRLAAEDYADFCGETLPSGFVWVREETAS